MARKSPKNLSLLKKGLIKSCLGGVAPKSMKKTPVVDDEDGDEPVRAKRPKGYASSVTPR